MVLDFKNDLELEGEDIGTSTEASISTANLPFIIDLITRQQYRDPIGSIIREITSNCFDAHIEAGVDLPVTIDFNSDTLGKYISFKDQGVGMSPDRIKNVYLSYGESTKRIDNKSIGGFGLGGKSPLSYTDMFYVTTVFDKIKYEYVVHKGKTLPKIELIDQSATTQRNGTEVKIYFVNPTDDYWTFISKAKKQLVYFDNVVYRQDWLFNNNYKIIEGKHFKCRIDPSNEDSTKYSDYIHLCIGKVPYPIDYNLIKRDTIRIPIALKFEIGELIVTPDRESIRYVDINGRETEDIIKDKLDLAIAELKELYYKQDSLKVDSLVEYLNRQEEEPELNIHGLNLNLESIIDKSKVTCSLLDGYIGEFSEKTFSAYVARYDHLRLRRKGSKENVERINLYFLKSRFYLKKGRNDILKNQHILENESELRYGKIEFKGYRALYELTGFAKRKKLNPRFGITALPYETPIFESSAQFTIEDNSSIRLGGTLTDLNGNIVSTTTYPIYVNTTANTSTNDPWNGGAVHTFYSQAQIEPKQFIKAPLPFDTNVIEQLRILKRALDTEIARITESYDDYVIPADWIKARQIQKQAIVARKEEEIIVYNWSENQSSARRECIKLDVLKEFRGIIIYGYDEDEFLLDNFTKLFRNSKYNNRRVLKSSLAVRIFKTAKKNGKEFRSYLPNSVHVTRFINNNKVFKHFATTLLMLKEKQKVNFVKLENKNPLSFLTFLQYIYPEKCAEVLDVDNYIENYGRTLEDLDEDFIESILTVALQHNLIDEDIYKKFKSVESYVDRTELLNSTTFTHDNLPYVVDYLALKKKKISEIWTKPKQYEIDLIKDNVTRLEYQLSLTDSVYQTDGGRFRKTSRPDSNSEQRELNIQKALLTYYNYTNYGITKEN
jgi:hypothetical protein